ncbi:MULTISPECIES: hypothetical protein [unclassified Vibrio]|uniref:hypothetical protein n=1 Tax=unclassified Vibrio TaxID=2614977 RepID=UPI001360FD03|nr:MULTISPECIES: hypothetical protein [unclassified Vibrio]NAW57768.1 hypothetical protein [Vibrio sp. V36_P2S2PM302]NAX28415.1 hypothetical protein [Vibrio sp. V38_P2S17PM301]NAX29581.1 hypothetical protein [Vibrio sp. V37_P2S8PM304]
MTEGVENHVQTDESVDVEMRQLQQIAAEIDGAQTLPLTENEQAELEETQRQQSIDEQAVALADEQYLAAVQGGVDALWTMAAPNWKLEEAELAPMAQLTKMVIDKHFPNLTENAGPEVMLGMVALSVITSRVSAGIPPRGKIPGKGGDDEQD